MELLEGCATHRDSRRAQPPAPARQSHKARAEPGAAFGTALAQAKAAEPREKPGTNKITEEQNSAPNRQSDAIEIAQPGLGHRSSASFRKPTDSRAAGGKQKIPGRK